MGGKSATRWRNNQMAPGVAQIDTIVDVGYSSDTIVDIDGIPAIQWLI